MSVDLQHERRHAHALLDLLPPAKLGALRSLLEVMIDEDDRDTLSPAEAKAIAEADEWSNHNQPIPHEEVLSAIGVSLADWEKMSHEP